MMRKIIVMFALFFVVISCKYKKENTSDFSEITIKPKSLENAILESGTLQRVDSFPSQYIEPRPVDIWLPDGYSSEKKYNVFYMHDGQNLFDANTTWNNQEMKVDEWVSELIKKDSIDDMIVIAIHNIPKIRFLDYYPEKTLNYLSEKVKDSLLENSNTQGGNISFEDFKGDEYLKFLVTELKPFVDSTYATLTEQTNTFIGGSSMGGLISMYAMCEYPDVFSRAACISTHWPGMNPTKEKNSISKAIFDYMEANLPSPERHKFYFDYGTETLDAFYPKYLEDVDSVFAKKGYTGANYRNLEFEGADHSESSWNIRFDIPLLFLLKK